MNSAAASHSFDELEGRLQLAVQQIGAAPPPADSAKRVLERAAKWEPSTEASPVGLGPKDANENKSSFLYVAVGMSLAVHVMINIAIAMFGGSPPEKPIVTAPNVEKPEPKKETLPNVNPKAGGLNADGAVPSPPEPPEKRLGAQSPGNRGGFGANPAGPMRGGARAAGTSPSRWLSIAGEATILVTSGGKDPIRLGEKQAYSNESILHVWDWSKSDVSRPLDISSAWFSVSPDGKWIVTVEGKKIEIATGKVSALPNMKPQPNRTLFSRDGRRIVLLLDREKDTSTFRILEFPGGEKLCEIKNQWPAMLPAAFAASSNEIFLMGKDGFVRRFDAATGKELQKYEPPHTNSLHAVTVSPSGKLLVSSSGGNNLLWDVASGKLLHKLVVEPAVYADDGVPCFAFSPDETQVAGGGGGGVLLWSVESGKVVKNLHRDSWSPAQIRFSADGKTITTIRGFVGTEGPAGEHLLVYPTVSKWDMANAK